MKTQHRPTEKAATAKGQTKRTNKDNKETQDKKKKQSEETEMHAKERKPQDNA